MSLNKYVCMYDKYVCMPGMYVITTQNLPFMDMICFTAVSTSRSEFFKYNIFVLDPMNQEEYVFQFEANSSCVIHR